MAEGLRERGTVRGRGDAERAPWRHDQVVADLLGALAQGLTMPLAARRCSVSLRTAHRRLAEARSALGVASTGALFAGATSTTVAMVADGTGDAPAAPLTDRQREVLDLVAVGATTAAVAVQLGITAATVESHLRSARLKLGAHTRWQAVACAGPYGGGT